MAGAEAGLLEAYDRDVFHGRVSIRWRQSWSRVSRNGSDMSLIAGDIERREWIIVRAPGAEQECRNEDFDVHGGGIPIGIIDR